MSFFKVSAPSVNTEPELSDAIKLLTSGSNACDLLEMEREIVCFVAFCSVPSSQLHPAGSQRFWPEHGSLQQTQTHTVIYYIYAVERSTEKTWEASAANIYEQKQHKQNLTSYF